MTLEEEAYAEARRCIREANETGALDLDFSQLALNRLPRELGRLHIVQNARPHHVQTAQRTCLRWQASLPSNRSTSLGAGSSAATCPPLARLTSLRELHMDGFLGIRRFAPLEPLLPTLKNLRLFGCKLDTGSITCVPLPGQMLPC